MIGAARPTSQQRALAICAELSDGFHRHGYLLGLYGSCLTATAGRDVDVLAVPWRDTPDPTGLDLWLAGKGWKREVAADHVGLIADARLYRRDHYLLDVRLTRPATRARTS